MAGFAKESLDHTAFSCCDAGVSVLEKGPPVATEVSSCCKLTSQNCTRLEVWVHLFCNMWLFLKRSRSFQKLSSAGSSIWQTDKDHAALQFTVLQVFCVVPGLDKPLQSSSEDVPEAGCTPPSRCCLEEAAWLSKSLRLRRRCLLRRRCSASCGSPQAGYPTALSAVPVLQCRLDNVCRQRSARSRGCTQRE